MVEQEHTFGIDELIRKMPLEERLYRHRCVEAWSMTVPWTGFPLADLVKLAKPLGDATYLRMETFMLPDIATGQKQIWYPWPYVEGLTMAEATNELAFLVTGAYGKPVAKSMGAPLRVHLPWKYGFKSIKSIVRFTFTDERPLSFWEQLAVERVRLLGERQSRGAASALEPGDGARHHHRRVDPDAALQRLRASSSPGSTPTSQTSRFTCEVRLSASPPDGFEEPCCGYAASAFSSTTTSARPSPRMPALSRSILVP